VQRLFGEIEVAEEAGERGEDAARLLPIDRVDRLPRAVGHVLTHLVVSERLARVDARRRVRRCPP
jgi:hypothetical protein